MCVACDAEMEVLALRGQTNLMLAKTIPIGGDSVTYSIWLGNITNVQIDGVRRDDLPQEDPAYGDHGLKVSGHASAEAAWAAFRELLRRVTRCRVGGGPVHAWSAEKDCLIEVEGEDG